MDGFGGTTFGTGAAIRLLCLNEAILNDESGLTELRHFFLFERKVENCPRWAYITADCAFVRAIRRDGIKPRLENACQSVFKPCRLKNLGGARTDTEMAGCAFRVKPVDTDR